MGNAHQTCDALNDANDKKALSLPTKNGHPTLVGVPIFYSTPRYARGENGLRIDAVFQRFTWLERNGVAGLDFDGFTGLRV